MQDSAFQPVADCPCASQRCRHRLGALRDGVGRELLFASCRDYDDDRHRFIPRGLLKTILSHENVRTHMQTLLGFEEHDCFFDNITSYVSPSDRLCPNCQKEYCTVRRGLFATLIMMGEEDKIVEFHRSLPQICDSTFPLRAPGADKGPTLHTVLEIWPDASKDLFYYLQWQMKSPYFDMQGPMPKEIRQFEKELILPWVYAEYHNRSLSGEISFIKEIQIHPDHHKPRTHGNRYALKIFEQRRVPKLAEMSFKKEFEGNRRTTHPRIVPLLSAFRHKSIFYFIFPWANGGSLQELWENCPTSHGSPGKEVPWYSDRWMADQCYGIADAVAAVHGYRDHTQSDAPPSEAQLHHDIKPENIVCYKDQETSSYTLKLTDFGLSEALERGASLRQDQAVKSKTYRPPEADIPGSYIGHTWDVWCLGCLYLDFITWVLLGWTELNNFGEMRLAEVDDANNDHVQNPVLEDVFFWKRRERNVWRWFSRSSQRVVVEIKPSVTSHISKLRNHPECNGFLRELIDYVDKEMLVINSRARTTSDKVRDALRAMGAC
ncbi:kinase-like protein [Colletotrichum sublineola]|nr:kinase-like protein [Colletotrichum sublineola]